MKWDLAKKETERVLAQNISPSISKTHNVALSDAFQAGFEFGNNGLVNSSPHFIGTVLMKVALKRSLGALLNKTPRAGLSPWSSLTHLQEVRKRHSGFFALLQSLSAKAKRIKQKKSKETKELID